MLGDLLLRILEKWPKPLISFLTQVREENLEIARLTGQAPAYYIKTRPMGPTQKSPKERIDYVV